MARSRMVRDHLPPVRDQDPDDVPALKLDEFEVKAYVGGRLSGGQHRSRDLETMLLSGGLCLNLVAQELTERQNARHR